MCVSPRHVYCVPYLDLFLNRSHDEPLGGIRHVRRIPHPGRGGATRTRRANMHYQTAGNALSGLSSSSRETMDPIAGEKQSDSVLIEPVLANYQRFYLNYLSNMSF